MIAELIPKIAAAEAASDRYEGPWRPRCSESGTERCIRQSVYKAVGAKATPIPGRTALIFEDGDFHEELTLDWIRKTVFRVHSEQLGVNPITIPDSHPGYDCGTCKKAGLESRIAPGVVHGHLDAIVTDPLGQDYLLEHKSASRFASQRWATGEEVPWDYVTQTAMYVRGIRLLSSNVRKAILLIKNKDTAAYLEYGLSFSADEEDVEIEWAIIMEGEAPAEIPLLAELRSRTGIIATATERLRQIVDYRARHVLPTRPFDHGHWRCDYCPFGGECWAGYAAETATAKAAGPIVLDGELLRLATAAALASKQNSDAKKRHEETRNQLLVAMMAAGARDGFGESEHGRVTVSITVQERESIDKDKIPEAILKAATVINESEVVRAQFKKGTK